MSNCEFWSAQWRKLCDQQEGSWRRVFQLSCLCDLFLRLRVRERRLAPWEVDFYQLMKLSVLYEGESNENLESAIKIRTTARLSVSFNSGTDGLKSGRQVAVRYYIEKWSHCVPFIFNNLRDKTYLRFSFDSPSYKHKVGIKTRQCAP